MASSSRFAKVERNPADARHRAHRLLVLLRERGQHTRQPVGAGLLFHERQACSEHAAFDFLHPGLLGG
jgi:hypothetical protein